ncbi:hypothetical protein, partial [Alistipes finegoldii]|uniref:hypothetical protein n=1 Tax=Alistipes finegoldii TaxID=214856 RepID=UPI003AB738E0
RYDTTGRESPKISNADLSPIYKNKAQTTHYKVEYHSIIIHAHLLPRDCTVKCESVLMGGA